MEKEQFYLIMNYMLGKGYFKNSREYIKAIQFADEENIPNWLMKDIEEYNEIKADES